MKLDDVKKLHQKKYRNQFGYYLVEGEHLILELIKAYNTQPIAQHITVFVTQANEEWASKQQCNFKVVTVTDKKMMQISDTKSPQGILATVPPPASEPANKSKESSERTIYLHEVQDPGNLGTILRTLAWFGNFRLLLSPNSVDPYNAKVVRASMGAVFHLPLELDVPINQLSTRFQRFAYLDLNGEPIYSTQFSDFDCYLFGNEARGVPHDDLKKTNAVAFTIPGNGSIESLNLASAVGMCSYQLSIV